MVTILLFSCKKDKDESGSQPLAEKTELNVPYGADPNQKMDVYLPGGRTTASTKLIILIHGGGWTTGDKADLTTYVDTLKKRLPGWAIINVNYRLATGTANFFPAQENDIKAAVEFIYGKRNEYMISDKYVILGMSAGAHLALQQAYKITSPIKMKAVVDFYGPTDMPDMYNNPPNPLVPLLMVQVTGGTPTTQASLYASSSPVNYVSSQCPPTIIFHGGIDIVVSVTQSVALKAKLTLAGVTSQLFIYPTENHAYVGPNLTDSFDKTVAFINANVN